MQVKLQRSERKGGLFKNKVIYRLDVRIEFSPEERDYINSHKMGGWNAYAHSDTPDGIPAILTVAELVRGQTLETEDLASLMATQQALVDTCRNIKTHLEAGATMDGGETVIEL